MNNREEVGVISYNSQINFTFLQNVRPDPAGLDPAGLLLVLAQFSTQRKTAIERYREFVRQGIDQA